MTTTDGIDPGGQSSGLFTLDKFAQHPFYQEVNRRLVALTGLRTGQHVVDLGAGTGAVTRVLLDSSDGEREWGSIGVSENIIEASWEALVDSLEYAFQPREESTAPSERTDPARTT